MSEHDGEQLSDEETLGKLTEGELSTLIQINETHMCHVEREKLSFLRIYLAAVSFIMAAVFIENLDTRVRLFLISFGLIIGTIVLALSNRWTHVFDNHKKIMVALIEQMLKNEGIDIDEEKKNDLNRYFLFNNRKYEFKDYKEEIKKLFLGKRYKSVNKFIFKMKSGHITLKDDGTYNYVSTGRLISAFVAVTLVFLGLLMIVLVFFP